MVKKKIKVSDILGDNYYVYELTSSNYTPTLNGSITITCTMKDVYGTAASGKSITLYQNGTSKGSQTTNSSGVATWSITCSTAGLQIFSIKDTSIEVFVDNKEDTSNKVTSLSSSSTDTQYPSAKAVYDANNNHSHNIFDLNPSSQYGDSAIESGVDRNGAGLGYGSEFLIYNSQEQKFYYDKNGNADYDTGNELATLSDIPNISGKEDNTNKVTSLSSSSTDTQYPSAKAVYDAINKQECYFDGDDFVVISDEQTITKTLTIMWVDQNNKKEIRPRYLQSTINGITAYLSDENDWSVSVPVDTEDTYDWSIPTVLGYTVTSIDEFDNNETIVTLYTKTAPSPTDLPDDEELDPYPIKIDEGD